MTGAGGYGSTTIGAKTTDPSRRITQPTTKANPKTTTTLPADTCKFMS